jgi:hypothetical protein
MATHKNFPDFENMGRALTIMKEFTETYPQYTKEISGQEMRFCVQKKNFFGRVKVIAIMTISPIKDFAFVNIHPDFDENFLLLKVKVGGDEKESFATNLKYLKKFADDLFVKMKEAGKGQPLSTAVRYLAEAATYQKMAKELDYFDGINIE